MSVILDSQSFDSLFSANLRARSRTAKGVSDTGTSKKKKKLLLEGDALKIRVAQNTQALIARKIREYFSRTRPISGFCI